MNPKSTAFALIGDRFHNSDYIRSALGKILVRELGLTIDFTDEVELLSARNLDGYRLLIIFRDAILWPNGYGPEVQLTGSDRVPIVSDPPPPNIEHAPVDWMTAEQGEAIKAFVEAGGSALLYHNVTYIGTNNQPFCQVLRAATQGHPAIRPYRVQITNSDHPITQGVNDFTVTDEQHFMIYDGEPEQLLMRSVNEDGLTHGELGTSCEAGWAHDCGEGRVCYLAPGHNITTLWNPEYVKIQQNAVRWLLRDTL